MFRGLDDPAGTAREVAAWFANFSDFRSHGRRVTRDDARAKGVFVDNLEDDQTLQGLVLSVHHAAMHTLTATPTAKIVENHLGRAWILAVRSCKSRSKSSSQVCRPVRRAVRLRRYSPAGS